MSNPFNFWDMPDEVYGAMEDDYIFGMSSEPSTETLYDRLDRRAGRKSSLDKFMEAQEEYERQHFIKEKIEESPTRCLDDYWVYAESKSKYKSFTGRAGKWMCFIPEKYIDAAWQQVKDATERGLLGGRSKCSTKFGKKSDDYVIICHTYDWRDEKDVMRVREVLRELGFTKPLPYKTDEDTLKNRYAHNSKNISKYYE